MMAENLSVKKIEEGIEVASGKGKMSLSMVGKRMCEELAQHHLFVTETFGYQIARKIKFSPSLYFK